VPIKNWQEIKMNHKLLAALAAMIMFVSFFGIAFAEDATVTSSNPKMDALKERYQERIENVKEAYSNAQERFEQAKEDFATAKDKWIKAKAVWDSNKSDTNQFFTNAKNYMLRSTEKMQNHLEVSRARALNIKNISEADLNAIVADYDSMIADLEAILAKIEAAADKNELAAIAEEVKSVWMEAKAFAKRNAGVVVSANMTKLITNTENVMAKIQAKADQLDANGLDMTAVNAKLAEANGFIAQAKEQNALALSKFMSTDGSESDTNLMSEGKAAVKEAHGYLKKAHNSAKVALQEMAKAKRGAIGSEVSDDDNEDNEDADSNEPAEVPEENEDTNSTDTDSNNGVNA